MATEFENEVGRLMSQFNTPGLSVDMLAAGKRHGAYMGRLAEGGPHKVTREARYATVCIIKLMIAIEILMLAEKGQLSLDAAVGEYLPELNQGPKAKGKIFKIRHLLSHTTGYRSMPMKSMMPLAHESWNRCVEFLGNADQLFAPGMVFDDDHLSYVVLGQVIERLRSQPALAAVTEDIMQPLRITPHTRTEDAGKPEIYANRHDWDREARKWVPAEDSYEEHDAASSAVSSFSMSSSDILKLGEALLPSSVGAAAGPITAFIRENLFQEQVQLPREYSPLRFTRWSVRAFGLGVATFRDGHRGCFTVGRGQSCSLVYDPARKAALALAMNSPNALERDAVLNTLLARFAGDVTIQPEATSLDMDFETFMGPFTTRDVGGIYLGFTPDPIEIFGDPRGFTVRMDKQDRYRIEVSDDKKLVMHARMPVSLGLFQDPASRGPCLMMGMHAFRKVA